MFYVTSQYVSWIIAGALALGLLVGLGTWSHKPRGSWFSGWMSWASVLFVVGVFAATFRLLEGRAGVWLETALIMFAVYIVGCVAGSWLRALFAAPEPVLPRMEKAPAAVAAIAAVAVYPAPPAEAPLAVNSSVAYPGKRPRGLAQPDGKPDDLTRIDGVSALDQKMLNDLGIHHARQIAQWTPQNADWINYHMARPGRVEAEGWIAKAAHFGTASVGAAGMATAAVAAATVAANPMPSSHDVARAEIALPPSTANVAAPLVAQANAGTVQPLPLAAVGDWRAAHPGLRPQRSSDSSAVAKDDLKRIRGLSPHNEASLVILGISSYEQISGLGTAQVEWLESYLGTPGRILRENWIDQAKVLAQAKRNQAFQETPTAGAGIAMVPATPSPVTSNPAVEVKGTETESAVSVAADKENAHSDDAHIASLHPVPVAADLGDIDSKYPGKRPAGLERPRHDEPDDLLKIKGVGKANLHQLHALGIFHFDQIAKWSKDELRWVGSYMAFPGRLDREDWIGQAKHYAQRRAVELANRAATHRKH